MKKYVFKPYSKNFPKLFEKEKERIISHLQQELLIEHVGSTAVPDLGGKGIIDIAIAVSQKEVELVAQALHELGYEFRTVGSTPERLYFRTDLSDEKERTRRYHIHLTCPESADWKNLTGFRDRLRANPDEAEKYEQLKREAVEKSAGDGSIYREIKGIFFKKK